MIDEFCSNWKPRVSGADYDTYDCNTCYYGHFERFYDGEDFIFLVNCYHDKDNQTAEKV